MKDQGFLACDICNPSRLHNNALMQVDIFFVPENFHLRATASFNETVRFSLKVVVQA